MKFRSEVNQYLPFKNVSITAAQSHSNKSSITIGNEQYSTKCNFTNLPHKYIQSLLISIISIKCMNEEEDCSQQNIFNVYIYMHSECQSLCLFCIIGKGIIVCNIVVRIIKITQIAPGIIIFFICMGNNLLLLIMFANRLSYVWTRHHRWTEVFYL